MIDPDDYFLSNESTTKREQQTANRWWDDKPSGPLGLIDDQPCVVYLFTTGKMLSVAEYRNVESPD